MKRSCFVFIVLALCIAGNICGQTVVDAVHEHWIRERSGGAYDDDGISVWNSAKGDSGRSTRRYGLIEFDLSEFSGAEILAARLELYSPDHDYGDAMTAIKQSAYIIDCSIGRALADLEWATYMDEKDPGKIALNTLGAYDLPEVTDEATELNRFYASFADESDLALVQDAVDSDGSFCIVLIAEESETAYARSWGDGDTDWSGGDDAGPRLVLDVADGRALYPKPISGQLNVPPDIKLEWEVMDKFYNETPYFKVYITDTPDANFLNIEPVTVSLTEYQPDPALEYETTYYWKVDVIDPNYGTEKVFPGDVWELTTGPEWLAPTSPSPGDGALVSSPRITLGWVSDSRAFGHEVWVRQGLEWQLVAEIDAEGLTECEFEGQWGKGYDWQVFDLFPGGVVKESEIWTFSVVVPSCNGGERLPGDEDGDCHVTLADLAIMAANWMVCGWIPAESCGEWPPVAQEGIEASLDIWLWDRWNTQNENDLLSVFNSGYNGSMRIGILEFDLSSLAGRTIKSATLQMYQTDESLSKMFPMKQHAYVIDPNMTPIESITWDAYQAEYAGKEVALESLGTYDLDGNVPSQMNTFLPSVASPTDIALIQAEVDGDGVLSIVLMADEDGNDYRIDWGDRDYSGGKTLLEIILE